MAREKPKRGGRSGPRTCFPGKEARPVCVLLTPVARQKLEDTRVRLGISRSDVVEALLRSRAELLTEAGVARVTTTTAGA